MKINGFIGFIICGATALIGHAIHGSIFWSVVDFFFAPIAWLKWFICKEVTLEIIKRTFSFFMN